MGREFKVAAWPFSRAVVVDRLLQLSGVVFVAFSIASVFQLLLPAGAFGVSDAARVEVRLLVGVTWAVGLVSALVGLCALMRPGSRRRWAIAVIDLVVMAGLWATLLIGLSVIMATAWDDAETLTHALGASALGDEIAHERLGGRSFGLGDPPTVISTRLCRPQDLECRNARRDLADELRARGFGESLNSDYWTGGCQYGLAFVGISPASSQLKTGTRAALSLRVAVDVGAGRCS